MSKNLTPYDTGERLEPKLWVTSTAGVTAGNKDSFGKVDFENDESCTAFIAYAEPRPGGEWGSNLFLEGIDEHEVTIFLDGRRYNLVPVE